MLKWAAPASNVFLALSISSAAHASTTIIRTSGDVTIGQGASSYAADDGGALRPGDRIESGARSSFTLNIDGKERQFGARATYVEPAIITDRPFSPRELVQDAIRLIVGEVPGTGVPAYFFLILAALGFRFWLHRRVKAIAANGRVAYNFR